MNEIIYQGKPLPIHFGLKTIYEFTKLNGTSFEEAVTTTNIGGDMGSVIFLAISGLNEGSRKSGSDKRYTQNDIFDMFDDEPNLIMTVANIFMEAIIPLTEKLGALKPKGMPAVKQKRKP